MEEEITLADVGARDIGGHIDDDLRSWPAEGPEPSQP